MMDKDLQRYYESSFELFASEGWKYLIEDFEKLATELSNIRTATDAQQLHYRQGQLDILDLVLKRKEMCEKVYEELQHEQEYLR